MTVRTLENLCYDKLAPIDLADPNLPEHIRNDIYRYKISMKFDKLYHFGLPLICNQKILIMEFKQTQSYKIYANIRKEISRRNRLEWEQMYGTKNDEYLFNSD